MHDPKDQPIDIEEQRKWLEEHKRDTGLSWQQLATRLGPGINKSTLGLFVTGHYQGRLEPIAEAIFRFRQTLAAQAALRAEGPEIPGFFQTETSNQLVRLLQYAQRGRITVGALAAGLGKSITAEHFRACNANVFLVTIFPSTSGIYGMQRAVLKQLGIPNASGSPEALSSKIMDAVRDLANGLLIFDEAQHLTVRAIEEIRGWYDVTKVGVALLGNKSLLQQLEGSGRSDAYAQIFSRVSLPLVRLRPLDADVDALLEAWRIHDEKIATEVHRIAELPGGLRSVTWTLELASMIAAGGREELAAAHVQDAWTQLSSRRVAA
jgi:DNA transposition AAA+ family ATPase